MRNFLSIDEKSSVREFIINDLIHVGLRIDPTKHRHILSLYQPSPHLSTHSKQHAQTNSRVFNVSLHQMDTIPLRLDEFDLTVPIFLRWCFDQIRRSIKHEGLFRKSGGSQRIKELMARIDEGSLAPSLSSSNTVFDVCSLFKEFLRRLTYPLITHPLQDLLLDCFSMRQLPPEKKIEMYSNILLLLPDEHLHALIYILRFLQEITLHERENKMNAKNLAICVGPGLMRATIDGKGSLMTEQCATNVSDLVEALILHASQLGYVTDSIYERSQMLIEMRQKEVLHCPDDSFALENGGKNALANGKFVDPSNAKKRRSGSVKEFLVHMTNRFRRRSGSNNDSRDHTNAFLDQTGKLSSSHTREHRYHNYQYYQQNSISEQCLSPQSTSTHTNTTTKRKSSDDPNGSSSKRGKTKTSSQEKSALPNANRFTSPLTAFRRKKKTPCHTNDPGFPFKIEHSHLPQMLHFTDEVPLRFSNNLVNPSSLSSSSSSLATKGAAGSLATSVIGHGDAHQTSLILPSDSANPANNKSLDAKKLNLLDSWKWPKSSRKAERKPLLAIHAPMLVPSAIDSSSLGELCPSPIKSTDESIQTLTQQIGSSSLLMHSSFGVHRHHSEEIGSQSFSTGATCRPRRSISSSSGQAHTRHIIGPMATQPTEENMNVTQEDQGKDSFDDDDEEEENNQHDELNLAVVDGNEDAQSLRAELPEGVQQENGSLDVAFIDEADLERLAKQSEQSHSPMNTTEPLDSNADAHQTSAMMVSVLMEKSLNKDDELDDILRRNANRAIRLTDSDDEDNENLPISTTSNKESQFATNTPKIPVRLCSSITSLLASDSISDLPSNKSFEKERLLSASLSHTLHDILPFGSEHDENTSILNGGRKSILVLKDTLAGRVSRQVRAIEQRSTEQISNRSLAPSMSNETLRASAEHDERVQASFLPSMINTPEQRLIEDALKRGKKFVYVSTGTGENSRSVKRLQTTPRRPWKERVNESEEDRRQFHSPSSPLRFLNKTKKKKIL